MEIPIPFVGWIEDDSPEELIAFLKSELKSNSITYTFGHKRMQEIVDALNKLKEERDLYKDGFERGNKTAA